MTFLILHTAGRAGHLRRIYMRELPDSRDSADAWELQKDNICCLSTNVVFESTE